MKSIYKHSQTAKSIRHSESLPLLSSSIPISPGSSNPVLVSSPLPPIMETIPVMNNIVPIISTSSRTDYETLRSQFISIQNQNSNLQGQYNDLRVNFQKQLDESLRLSQENLDFRSELDALRHKILIQNSDLIQKNTMLEQQEKQNKELHQLFSTLEQQARNLKNTVTQKDTDIEQQLKVNADLQQKNLILETEKQKSKDDLIEKNAKIEHQEKLHIELQLKFKKNIESWEEQLRKLLPKGNISELDSQTNTIDLLPPKQINNKLESLGQTNEEIDSNYELVGEIVDSC